MLILNYENWIKINVNVTDIKDESGYIEALGKEAAAKAINEAKISGC
jgi:flotillin